MFVVFGVGIRGGMKVVVVVVVVVGPVIVVIGCAGEVSGLKI